MRKELSINPLRPSHQWRIQSYGLIFFYRTAEQQTQTLNHVTYRLKYLLMLDEDIDHSNDT